jgi:hypothetical protein
MQGPLIFFACLLTATLSILGGLYAIAREAKPRRAVAPYRRVRFTNFR